MLRWFERRLNPYPTAEPEQPPSKLFPFFMFYLRGTKRLLVVMAVAERLVERDGSAV